MGGGGGFPRRGAEGWGPEGWGPKISRFSFRRPPLFSFFLPLLRVVSWIFGRVIEGWDPQMCTFGVLGLSCEALAAPKPPPTVEPPCPPTFAVFDLPKCQSHFFTIDWSPLTLTNWDKICRYPTEFPREDAPPPSPPPPFGGPHLLALIFLGLPPRIRASFVCEKHTLAAFDFPKCLYCFCCFFLCFFRYFLLPHLRFTVFFFKALLVLLLLPVLLLLLLLLCCCCCFGCFQVADR